MRMVVRFEILDTKTGKRVTDKDGATIKLVLPHGQEIPARWTIRGGAAAMPDSAWMWDTSWDIPPDYPIAINAVSGYSGGGRSMIEAHDRDRGPAFELYGLGLEHKHVPETQLSPVPQGWPPLQLHPALV